MHCRGGGTEPGRGEPNRPIRPSSPGFGAPHRSGGEAESGRLERSQSLRLRTSPLRMSEFVFDLGVPGLGALAKEIWRDQAQQIKAMGQWRRAWFPEAPIYPVALKPSGDPNAMADLIRMSPAQIQAMQMIASTPTRENRVTWFLEGTLQRDGLNQPEYHAYDKLFALN
jgi:hypothetical protein